MSPCQHAAGTALAVILIWAAWAGLAPIVAGHPALPEPRHECPNPYLAHGVGENLKTFARPADRCRSHE